jgi:hypothetical protein
MAATDGSFLFPAGRPNGASSVSTADPWSQKPYPKTID